MRSVTVSLVAALVAASPVFSQDKVFTLDDVLGGARVSLAPRQTGQVTWAGPSVYRLTRDGETKFYDAKTGKLTDEPKEAPAAPAAPTARPRRRAFAGGASRTSPDGKFEAIVKENNLYLRDTETKAERQITFDGTKTILNGILDWVYDEEVYGRGGRYAIRWSPDSKKVAFLRLDEAPVQPFPIIDHLPRTQNTENWQYPLPGDPNPKAKLAVADVSTEKPTIHFVDTAPFVEDDLLIVRFSFTPDSSRIFYQLQNREQNVLELRSADAATGGDSKTLITEKSEQWIDVTDFPTWLADGTFLWTSDRSGFLHLYRYQQDGTLVAQITRGDYDCKNIDRIDEEKGLVYFIGNGPDVSGSHYYRAWLDGKKAPLCLTQGNGTHSVAFSPGEAYFLDTYSSAEIPGQVRLCDGATGAVLKTLTKAEPPQAATQYKLGQGKFVTFKARDGYTLEGTLLLPPGYNPKKRYPIYYPVYAGPSAPTCRNSYSSVVGSIKEQFLAQNGIIVWKCDNRTANPRGTKAQKWSHKRLGVTELMDIEDGLKFLIDQGIADPGRIAIEGWSYGGFMTSYALTHSTMFKVGIAGAPPTDWRLYDTIYTERYMSTPQKNPEGYKISSSVEGAVNLHGKLLIVHGMMDDNVHFQNSVQLMYALEKAGKDFDTAFYPSPSSRHGIGDFELSQHSRRKMLSFLINNL